MFTEEQIQEIIDLIDFQLNFFIAGNISDIVLSHKDKLLLTKLGIDYKTPKGNMNPFEQAYYFGKLASILGPIKTGEIDFEDFKKYIRRGQYQELSKGEKATLEYLQNKSYSHIKKLQESIKVTTAGIIREQAFKNRQEYEQVISNAVQKAALEKRVVSEIVSEIGHASKDWSRDLGRIAETELQDAFEYGKAASYAEQYGDDVQLYKTPYPAACKHCISLYLTDGLGSEPIVFSYKSLLANGNNIGRKVNDWKAVIGTVHPFCRCPIHVKRNKDDVWDNELQMFVPKVREKSPGVIKITVGDKQLTA